MKKRFGILILVIFFIGIANVAMSAPYTWTDIVNENVLITDSYTYTHDITDGADGFVGYLDGGDDIIYSYSLTIQLWDDGGRRDYGELAFIDQPGLFGDGLYNFSYTSAEYGWSLAGVVSLNIDGLLSITIDSVYGDFIFGVSTLVAEGDNGSSAPVPEPTTLFLLGTGLVGIAGASRKKIFKRN